MLRRVRRVDRNKHLLNAAQVGRQVLLEAAGHEGARGVAASKEVVRAAGAVEVAAGGDVVDAAVQADVDWFGGVGAVEGGELGVGQANGPGLCRIVVLAILCCCPLCFHPATKLAITTACGALQQSKTAGDRASAALLHQRSKVNVPTTP